MGKGSDPDDGALAMTDDRRTIGTFGLSHSSSVTSTLYGRCVLCGTHSLAARLRSKAGSRTCGFAPSCSGDQAQQAIRCSRCLDDASVTTGSRKPMTKEMSVYIGAICRARCGESVRTAYSTFLRAAIEPTTTGDQQGVLIICAAYECFSSGQQ